MRESARVMKPCLVLLVFLLGCGVGIEGRVASDKDDGVPQGARRAFITNASYGGNFATTTGSVDGPCAIAKAAAGLKLNYIAIVSTSVMDARDRVTGAAQIYKVVNNEPVLVANAASELWSGVERLLSQLDSNEYGVALTDGSARVWSGTTVNGLYDAGRSCDDWTNLGTALGGSIGYPYIKTSGWIRYGVSLDCGVPSFHRGVFCISI